MKTFLTPSLSLLICTLLLSGCGQTGALYLPETDETASPQDQPQETPETDAKAAPDV